LLEQDELVGVFPEGYPIFGRSSREGYEVGRFNSSDFVRMALMTNSPIIPVALVPSVDPTITRVRSAAQRWIRELPLFSAIITQEPRHVSSPMPLPTKIFIEFGDPITLEEYGPEDSSDLGLGSEIADHVREIIQQMISDRQTQ
jgi:1-acyl-sn-glycerol-3-phosphate acyltransferase